MKYKRISFVTILAIVLMLSGCQGNDAKYTDEAFQDKANDSSKYEPEYGGQIILPITKTNSLNPLTANNESYFYFSKLIFESLFEFDDNFKVKNELVEDYAFKEPNTLSIKLKDNVYWHDGEKLSSQDVAFTINTIKYASNETIYKRMWSTFAGNYNYSNINNIINVKAIDNLNLEIEFNGSVGNKLELLTFPIIPRHRFVNGKENIQSYKSALEEDNYVPIGTGPYKFVNYEKNKSIELAYNENYRNGRPYIDKIIGKILASSELVITAFETGQVDLALSTGFDWEKFEQNKNVKIVEFISQGYEFLGFNFNKQIINRYVNLRKAIAYGIDRQSIIEEVFLGHATQTDLPIHPNSWVLSDNSSIYGFNLDKAKEELEKMGWKDIDGDGFYEDENGNDIILRLTTNSYNPIRLKVADLVVENLNRLGVNVVKDYPDSIPDNITQEMMSEQWEKLMAKITNGDFDIVLLGWDLSPIPDLSFAFHSSGIRTNSNFIRYNSETMDNALAHLVNADEVNKLNYYKKVESIILEDLPYVSLFFKNRALLINNKVKGKIDPTFYDIYRNIEEWYIPENLQ